MIECTNEYIYKKKRHKKLWRFIALLIVLTILISIYSNLFVSKIIYNICSSYIEASGLNAINNAVVFSMLDEGEYADIVSVEKNAKGEISLISISPTKTNKITRKIITKTNIFMSDIINRGVPIPLLAFSGLNLLSGYGKKINYNSILISKINCEFANKFKGVGINQTLHSVYADVIVEVSVIFQFNKMSTTVKSSVLLCESVIVGKVPDIYLGNKFL